MLNMGTTDDILKGDFLNHSPLCIYVVDTLTLSHPYRLLYQKIFMLKADLYIYQSKCFTKMISKGNERKSNYKHKHTQPACWEKKTPSLFVSSFTSKYGCLLIWCISLNSKGIIILSICNTFLGDLQQCADFYNRGGSISVCKNKSAFASWEDGL